MASPIVTIAGFTGKLAGLITASILRSHPNVQIHGICRTPSKVDSKLLSNPNVKVFAADANDPAALQKALAGTSVCICSYLGDKTIMVDGQKTLVDACIAEKVPRYIASDWCIDYRKLEFGDHPSKDSMKHVRAYLEEKEKLNLIKGVHVLNGAFTEIVTHPMSSWANIAEGSFRYFGTGDEKLEITTYEDAARFTAEVAVDQNASGFFNVLGDSKSVKEMAEVYKRVHAVEPTVERLGSLDDLYATMTAVRTANPHNVYAWMGMYYQYYMTNGQTLLEKLDNDRYPTIKFTTFEDFLKAASKAA